MSEKKGDANDTITSDNVSGYANRLKKHLDVPKYKLNDISIPRKKQVFDFKPRTEPDIISSSVVNISKKNTGLLILTVIIELFFLLFGIFVLVFDKAESVNIDRYDYENLHQSPDENVHNSLVYFGSYSYQC
ncbi:hypothetical protein THOM_1702 [Trachipleistophora hominis]|uniref:Uncharacterized protein n=1 Tax=Trachipleistophora hominis TaxID=72359 RepID=L7JV46_TRAHO|nr:hypothetical protein THOM_1702 [Trachipleistophora hominis]